MLDDPAETLRILESLSASTIIEDRGLACKFLADPEIIAQIFIHSLCAIMEQKDGDGARTANCPLANAGDIMMRVIENGSPEYQIEVLSQKSAIFHFVGYGFGDRVLKIIESVTPEQQAKILSTAGVIEILAENFGERMTAIVQHAFPEISPALKQEILSKAGNNIKPTLDPNSGQVVLSVVWSPPPSPFA